MRGCVCPPRAPAGPPKAEADSVTRFRVLRTTVHQLPPVFVGRADMLTVYAAERPLTGVNETLTEPRLHHSRVGWAAIGAA
jgi:hypothetical protein